MTRFNPERRAWKGRSYRKGGERVRDLRDAPAFPRCSGCGTNNHSSEVVCPNRPEDDGSSLTEFDGPIPGYDEG